ncbi:transcriptional regulator, LysR family [Arboricoccus pini]|uniref:Transcriptional regulator, LysR family n=1 Tax=Arboricoccus pini TaxID=1963835 RepID=A0A212RLI7_9PROT|nr:LysR family transcriptional regulator [Arboricoccus pini]SNB73311.1 transcriptional regulator, LysR family [Arboricoccus pini]
MTLDQLRIFLAVAERQHVTLAAAALNLTQSTVSAAIKALETRYDTHLFNRIGRRIELTEAGRAFVPEAAAVLARAEAARCLLQDFALTEGGTLRVAASQTIASYWLPARLATFRARHPGVGLEVAIGNTAKVASAVLEGTAEIGLVEGGVDETALQAEPVGADRLVVVLGRDGLPGGQRIDTRQRLLELPWVSRERGSGTRTEFELAIAMAGLDPQALRIVLEMPSNEGVLGAVEAGLGAAAISELAAAGGIAAGRLQRLPFPLPRRRFDCLWHKERYRSRAGENFLAILRMGADGISGKAERGDEPEADRA